MPNYIDDKGAILRRGRTTHQCVGQYRSEPTEGPTEWNGTRASALAWWGYPPPPATWREHAPECPRDLLPGMLHVEYVGEAPAFQRGARYSIECAALYACAPFALAAAVSRATTVTGRPARKD